MTRRGLRGVKLVVSDAYEGIKAAALRFYRSSGRGIGLGMLKRSEVSDSLVPMEYSGDRMLGRKERDQS